MDEDSFPTTSGSTAAVAIICQDDFSQKYSRNGNLYAIVGNVGDSVAILCRKGKAITLTTSHTVQFEAARLVRVNIGRISQVYHLVFKSQFTLPKLLL